ncbi:hypothetical protein [Formosa sp. S-31]|uniref:hypothetical protein n=1 Tax=Formosa sp. S-31 TaxID=2790949 RepID=UPI003EBDB18E
MQRRQGNNSGMAWREVVQHWLDFSDEDTVTLSTDSGYEDYILGLTDRRSDEFWGLRYAIGIGTPRYSVDSLGNKAGYFVNVGSGYNNSLGSVSPVANLTSYTKEFFIVAQMRSQSTYDYIAGGSTVTNSLISKNANNDFGLLSSSAGGVSLELTGGSTTNEIFAVSVQVSDASSAINGGTLFLGSRGGATQDRQWGCSAYIYQFMSFNSILTQKERNSLFQFFKQKYPSIINIS